MSEPDGSATWFPVSDHPTDKATYSFDITVPDGLVAVANGLLEGSSPAGGLHHMELERPRSDGRLPRHGDGRRLRAPAVHRGERHSDHRRDRSRRRLGAPVAALALTSDMLTFFSDRFGPYPFVSYGAIVDDDTVGYALETQTRSVLLAHGACEGTVAHELAHQWMGNARQPRAAGRTSGSTRDGRRTRQWLWREQPRRPHRARTSLRGRCCARSATPSTSSSGSSRMRDRRDRSAPTRSTTAARPPLHALRVQGRATPRSGRSRRRGSRAFGGGTAIDRGLHRPVGGGVGPGARCDFFEVWRVATRPSRSSW